MSKISKNLPDERRYTPLKDLTKKPSELDWTNLSKALIPSELKSDNTGIILNDYVGIDCDKLELQLAVEQLIKTPTYTQKSAKRGFKQFIFKVDDFDENLSLQLNGKEVGEILCSGRQMVLAPSKYKITAVDVQKEPELNLKEGEIRQYEIIEDLPIAKISKKELMQVILEFESKLTQKAHRELKKFYQESEIDNLSITSVLSTSGMEQDNKGQYYGENPFHGSTTGHNFWINPIKNLAYCFRCDCAISPAKAIALQEGIINNCSDELRGSNFIKVVEVARQKYGFPPLNDYKGLVQEQLQDLKIMTIADYENYKPNKNWIIENRKYPNQREMRFGDTGTFKSTDAIQEGLCIASGKKVYGKFKTKKCGVLYLSAENSIEQDKVLIKKIMRGLKIRKKTIPFYVLPAPNCEDIMNLSFQISIFNFISKNKIGVVYLDTINPLSLSVDDNNARDVTRLFKKFLDVLAFEYKTNVTLLAHTDKARKNYLGSTKWKANSDAVFRLERKISNSSLTNKFLLYNEKNRMGEKPLLEIQVNFGEKEITFEILKEGLPEIYQSKKKMTQAEFFEMKLRELCKKEMERKDIFDVFTKNKIKYSRASLDRAIKEWREE